MPRRTNVFSDSSDRSDMQGDSCVETLPWRMLQALAQAMAARVGRLPGRLPRVAHYACEIGLRLGWEETRLRALRVAALLHDAGELAAPGWTVVPPDARPVPWKAHVWAGAAMLQGIGCDEEAVAMARSHHEYWDGTGYPDGLRGESIPAGARVLGVAQCLAVLPPPEALAALERGAGAQFDPEIVAMVLRNHGEIERAAPPACGAPGAPASEAWLELVASAARRDRLLRGLMGEMGRSLVLAETLGEFDGRLRKLIGYRSMAVWTPRENRLVAAYVSGADARWLCSLEIQFGRGVSGRVAETGRAVSNGNPAEEGEYMGPGTGLPQSVTAVPLEHGGELAAVLALYHGERGSFQEDDLEILLHIRTKLAAAVAHALQYESLEKLATEDAATRLPNERALFLRLDAELARCRRTRGRLAVLVCDVGAHRLRRRPGALQAVAAGLRRLCREEDCVARMGDRFVLVLSAFAEHHVAEKRRRMEAMMAEICPAMDGERPAVQVAAAFFPDDGAYAEDLLAVAEARMTAAAPSGAGEANPA